MATIQCPATVTTSIDGVPLCLDGSGASVAWIVQPDFDVSQVLEGEAAAYFGAGFGIVTVCYALGHALRALFSLLR